MTTLGCDYLLWTVTHTVNPTQTITWMWTTDTLDHTMSLFSSELMKCTDCHKLLQEIAILETRMLAPERSSELCDTFNLRFKWTAIWHYNFPKTHWNKTSEVNGISACWDNLGAKRKDKCKTVFSQVAEFMEMTTDTFGHWSNMKSASRQKKAKGEKSSIETIQPIT